MLLDDFRLSKLGLPTDIIDRKLSAIICQKIVIDYRDNFQELSR